MHQQRLGGARRRWTLSGRVRAAILPLLCAATVLSLLVPADASEPTSDSNQETQRGIVVTSDRLVPPASGHAFRFVIWQAAQRAYFPVWEKPVPQIHDIVDVVKDNLGGGYPAATSLVAVDVNSGDRLAKVPLRPPGWVSKSGAESMAVDEARGLLYVAYFHPPRDSNAGSTALHSGIGGSGTTDMCTTVSDAGQNDTCSLGLHVFDAGSLDQLGSISFGKLRVDGLVLAPKPIALEASGGKVRVLLTEHANTVAPYGAREADPHGISNANLTYLLQADGSTFGIDWLVRVDGCRVRREPQPNDEYTAISELPHKALILRTAVDPDAVWVGCHSGSTRTATLARVPLDPAGNAYPLPIATARVTPGLSEPAGPAEAAGVGELAPGQQLHFGPDRTVSFLADAPSGRILMRSVDKAQEVWWVFDTAAQRFAGTIGIGRRVDVRTGFAGIDQDRGRLYVLSADQGLFTADLRTSPLPQALQWPHLATAAPTTVGDASLAVVQTSSTRSARLLVPNKAPTSTYPDFYRVIEDRRPPAEPPPVPSEDERSLDLDERAGVTAAAFDGAARGYGARMLLVGGMDAAVRAGPVDPIGDLYGTRDYPLTRKLQQGPFTGAKLLPVDAAAALYSPCTDMNRDVTLGFVGPEGPAIVDVSGGRAQTQGVVADSALRADTEAPLSRCTPLGWDSLWNAGLFGRPAVAEPALPWTLGDEASTCLSTSDRKEESFSDPVTSAVASHVRCDDDDTAGWAQARGFELDGLKIGQALSSFRIYRDAQRGIVSRVESAVRGLSIDGVVRVDSVRAVAESWANGRRQPVPAAQREAGYESNCDYERSAGTCFVRYLFGVSAPGYRCGPCGDEQRLIDGLNRAMGVNGMFQLREPDPELAKGSESGFQAAISKPQDERFSDLVLNNDLVQTVVPALEFIRFAPPARKLQGGGTRGRQVYQFAGVEASSSYAISCLLEYDPVANTCSERRDEPGRLTVELRDSGDRPLPGGDFEIRKDDGDGLLGVDDALIPNGVCVTGTDGVGTCQFDEVAPGAYLVSQVSAPAGYSAVAEPWPVDIAAGEARVVTFVNASNISQIEVTATREDSRPLPGATFTAYADPDGDGKPAPTAQPVASCTTNVSGNCSMAVPAGSYVLVQTVAPAGLEGVAPIPIMLPTGGAVAAVSVVNAPSRVATATPPAIVVEPPRPSQPVSTVEVTQEPPGPATPAPADAAGTTPLGGTITKVLRAPGDVLRLLGRSPMEAVAWSTVLALFAMAVASLQRRTALVRLLDAPARAGAGIGTPGAPRTAHRPVRQGRPAGKQAGVLDRPALAGQVPVTSKVSTARVVGASKELCPLMRSKLDPMSGCELVACVDSLDLLQEAIDTHQPAVIIVDLTLPPDGAEDVCDRLGQLGLLERCIGLIAPGAALKAHAMRGHQVGLAGLLSVPDDIDNGQLAYAARCVAAGKTFYGPTVQSVILREREALAKQRRQGNELTPRELEIARLAANGLTRTQIARQLVLSPMTVKRHLHAIRSKLGVTNPQDSAQLSRRLEERRLLE